MNKFSKAICFLTIMTFFSCTENNNPVEPVSNKEWKMIAEFSELKSPLIHFFDENEGMIAGKVYYDEPILTTTILSPPWANNTEIVFPELIDSTSEPKYPLWKTYDGGITWTPIKGFFSTSIIDMNFIDDLVGFLVTDYEGVYKTLDGGESWFRIMGSEIRFYSPGSMSSSSPLEINFYDSKNGILLMSRGPNDFSYLSTTDGGINWTFHYSPYIIEKVLFPEKNVKIGYATNYQSILKTSDGGNTWNSVTDYNLSYSFAFLDHNNWVLHKDHKLYWTSDGGNSFSIVHDFEDPKLYSPFLHDISKVYYSNKIFYLTNHEGIRVSADSCRSFILIPLEQLPFHDISIPNENIFYGTTNNTGKIYKYVDRKR